MFSRDVKFPIHMSMQCFASWFIVDCMRSAVFKMAGGFENIILIFFNLEFSKNFQNTRYEFLWEIFREKIPKSCGWCYEVTSFNTKVKVTSDLSELVLCENRQTRTTELRKCFRQDLSRFQSMCFRDMFYVFPCENRPQETIKVVWNERINPPVRARNSSGFYQGIPADVCQHKWFNCFVIHG